MDASDRYATAGSGARASQARPTAEETARGVFAAIAAHDLSAIGGYLHAEDVQEFVPFGVFRGRDAVLEFFAELFRAFPDLEMTVDHVLADASTAFVRWQARGTFTGAAWRGIEPTGDRVEMRGVDGFIEVKDGLIRRNTIFLNPVGLARSLGALPPIGSPVERLLLGGFNLLTRIRRGLRGLRPPSGR